MSLFGTSPENASTTNDPASRPKSLFDENSRSGGDGSLFNDGGAQDDSPWDMPTPKKSNLNEAVKSLLLGSDVPESYIDIYDTVLHAGFEDEPGRLSALGVRKVLESSRLSVDEQGRILKLVSGGLDLKSGLGRGETNVLLALIGLSQRGEESTLDSVDEKRQSEYHCFDKKHHTLIFHRRPAHAHYSRRGPNAISHGQEAIQW